MSGVKSTRTEWQELAFRYTRLYPEGVTPSQLGNAVPRSQCSEKLPALSKLPKIDGRFRFRDGRLFCVSPENEKPVPTGQIRQIEEIADEFYEFLKEQPTNSSLLEEELRESFTRWKEAFHQRAAFTSIFESLVKRKFLRHVIRSGRYVPRFRDPLVRRAAASASSEQGGIFVGEIEFEPTETSPNVGLSTTLSIRNDSGIDVFIEKAEWFQRTDLFSVTNDLPLLVPVGSIVELNVVYCSKRVGVHYNKCILYISGFQFMRECKASSATELADRLKPIQPFSRKERRRRAQRRKMKSRGRRPPSKGLPFTVKLQNYPIPSGFSGLVAGGELQEQLSNIRETLWTGETSMNHVKYAEFFSKLLFAEELALLQELESFGLEDVSFTREGDLYLIKVPGLSENRPSVRVGDEVEVSLSANPESLHYGFVHTVMQTTIAVSFSRSFHRLWSASALFTVDFSFKRTMYNIMRDTLCRISAATDVHQSVLLPRSESNASTGQLDFLPLDNPQWKNGQLNEEQRFAVHQMMQLKSQLPAPFVLFGPPGTGKTSTLVEAIWQLLQRRSTKLLVCAPSNAAADEIVKRLAVYDVREDDLVRIHAYSRQVSDVDPLVERYSGSADDYGHFIMPTIATLQRYRVVVTTCSTSAKLFYLGMPSNHFTHVIIDECGHCMEPEAISSFINLACESTRLIVAGDPEQLGPVVQSSVAGQVGLSMSLLERYTSMVPLYRYHDDGQYAETQGYNPSYIVKLVHCYRCHPEIICVPNRCFYRNQLIPSAQPNVSNSLLHWPHLPNAAFPLIFHSCNGENLQEAHSPSWFNIQEIETVMEYVGMLHEFGISYADIGIITPYRQQVKKMRQALESTPQSLDVLVGSCEQFQGQERKVIIISTVRSSPDLLQQDSLFNLGFVGDRKRFNVAVTRAQALLIVVGSPRVLCGDENWRELYHHCQENGACVGDVTWSGPEDVENRVEEIFGEASAWVDLENV